MIMAKYAQGGVRKVSTYSPTLNRAYGLPITCRAKRMPKAGVGAPLDLQDERSKGGHPPSSAGALPPPGEGVRPPSSSAAFPLFSGE